MKNMQEFIDKLNVFKQPVIVLHPDNKADFSWCDIEVIYHRFMDKDKIYGMDKSSLQPFDLEDIKF